MHWMTHKHFGFVLDPVLRRVPDEALRLVEKVLGLVHDWLLAAQLSISPPPYQLTIIDTVNTCLTSSS